MATLVNRSEMMMELTTEQLTDKIDWLYKISNRLNGNSTVTKSYKSKLKDQIDRAEAELNYRKAQKLDGLVDWLQSEQDRLEENKRNAADKGLWTLYHGDENYRLAFEAVLDHLAFKKG